jgi:sarcosine oxidase subunit alpha
VCTVAERRPSDQADRGAAIDFYFDDHVVRGYQGESLAAAALAGGHPVLSRSLKYHRPRGGFCYEGHCSGCLVRIDGVPNLRACVEPCRPGARVESQNAFPGADLDVLGVVDQIFPRGLDHHTFMTATTALNRVTSQVVRKLSGLGALPSQIADDAPEVGQYSVDVCIVGGGPAGLRAAAAAAGAGARTLLIDDQLALGGSLWASPEHGASAVAALVTAATAAGAALLPRSTAAAFFPADSGGILAVLCPDRLCHVRASQFVWACGGYSSNLLFASNDRPGVLAARAVTRLWLQHRIVAAPRIALVIAPPMTAYAQAVAAELRRAQVEVTLVDEALVARAVGGSTVQGLELQSGQRIDCEVIAVAALPAPASEGPRQHGAEVRLDPARGGYCVLTDEEGKTTVDDVWACGDVCGYLGPTLSGARGLVVGAAAARAALGRSG